MKALYELQRTGGRYALVTMCMAAAGDSPLCSNETNDLFEPRRP